jgi:hypothetical protein
LEFALISETRECDRSRKENWGLQNSDGRRLHEQVHFWEPIKMKRELWKSHVNEVDVC